jgi:LPS O-antigen subunit length determinant protein (WzzB/FepE family)
MYIEHKQTRKAPVPESVFSYAEPETAKLPNIKTTGGIESKGVNLEKPLSAREPVEKISKRAFILGMTAIIGTVIMVLTIVALSYGFEMMKYTTNI